MVRFLEPWIRFMLLNLEKAPQWLPLPSKDEPRSPDSFSGVSTIRISAPEEPYVPTHTKLQDQIAKRREKRAAHKTDQARQLAAYHPFNDPKIMGDPECTLFLGRLGYNVSERDVRGEFSQYGAIRSVRILHGYAFITYEAPNAVISAIQKTCGSTFWQGHRILLDFERARKQPFWKPRRLGGGLGGRFSLTRQRQDASRFDLIQRRGAAAINPTKRRKDDTRPERPQEASKMSERPRPYDRRNTRALRQY